MVISFWQLLCTNLKGCEILPKIGKIANGVRNWKSQLGFPSEQYKKKIEVVFVTSGRPSMSHFAIYLLVN